MSGAPEICRSLSARFYRLLDAGDYDGVAAQFAAEGFWLRQGERLVGAEAIKIALNRRSQEVVIRHLLTSVEIQPVSEDLVDLFGCVLVFRAQGSQADLPLPMPAGPSTLMTVHDRYAWIDDRWMMTAKSGTRILVSAAAH